MKATAVPVVWVSMARRVRCWDLEIRGPTGLSLALAPGTFREELRTELIWAQDVSSRKGDLILSQVGKRVGLRSCHWNCSRNLVCPALQLGPVSKTV